MVEQEAEGCDYTPSSPLRVTSMLQQLTDTKIIEASDILHIARNINAYQLAAELEIEQELAEWLLDSFRVCDDSGAVMLKRDAQIAIAESRR